MIRRFTMSAALVALLPHLAHAQANPMIDAMRANWQQVTGFVTATAEEMSDEMYAYRPTAGVRTLGELIGHVAGAQFTMCAAALGEPARAEDAVERTAKTKAALVAALRESTAYCARAYAQGADLLARPTQLFGQNTTRAHAIMLNAVHNGEHYGNMVTYMRMKGIVPPSSK